MSRFGGGEPLAAYIDPDGISLIVRLIELLYGLLMQVESAAIETLTTITWERILQQRIFMLLPHLYPYSLLYTHLHATFLLGNKVEILRYIFPIAATIFQETSSAMVIWKNKNYRNVVYQAVNKQTHIITNILQVWNNFWKNCHEWNRSISNVYIFSRFSSTELLFNLYTVWLFAAANY